MSLEQLPSFCHSGHIKTYEPALSELQFGATDSITKPFKEVVLVHSSYEGYTLNSITTAVYYSKEMENMPRTNSD